MSEHDNIPGLADRSKIVGVARGAALYGLSIPHFRRMYRSGRVPAPIKIGERKLGWPLGIILDDIAARTKAA